VAVYVVWAIVAVGALGLGLVVGTARHRIVVGTLAGLAIALSVGVDGFNLPPIGFDWQGRYGLPLLAGASLVALDGVRRERLGPALRSRLPALATASVIALLAMQVVAFVGTAQLLGLGRSSSAQPLAYVFGSTWEPVLPPVLLLAGFGIGIGLLGALCLSRAGAERAATVHG
jgi:hypothetical protein